MDRTCGYVAIGFLGCALGVVALVVLIGMIAAAPWMLAPLLVWWMWRKVKESCRTRH
jgi:hypothetical protein